MAQSITAVIVTERQAFHVLALLRVHAFVLYKMQLHLLCSQPQSDSAWHVMMYFLPLGLASGCFDLLRFASCRVALLRFALRRRFACPRPFIATPRRFA